jgi:hypothetical protein
MKSAITVSLLQKMTTSSSSLTYLDDESELDLADEALYFCGDYFYFTGDCELCLSNIICFFIGDFSSSESCFGVIEILLIPCLCFLFGDSLEFHKFL